MSDADAETRPQPPAQTLSAAQDWIVREAGYEAEWRDHGILNFPSASFFMGAPLSQEGDEVSTPIRPPLTLFKLKTYGANQIGPNCMVWLEASGEIPARLGPCYAVSLDRGVLAIGDIAASRALAALPSETRDHTLKSQVRAPHFVSLLDVPGGAGRIFFASGGDREQVIAATVLSEDGAVSGILIDFVGRALDGEHTAISLNSEGATP